MKSKPKHPIAFLFMALALGALGQVCLVQSQTPGTLFPGILFYAFGIGVFLWVFRNDGKKESRENLLPLKKEIIFFTAIMFLAAFLRLYQLETLPPGIASDQGYLGWEALRLLHEGSSHLQFFDNSPFLVYQLALWFLFVPPTGISLYLFFVVLSLAAFPFIYWTFRQLAGTRVALISLFLLAVMRWHIHFSRNGYPAVEILLYMFIPLALLHYGLKNPHKRSFFLLAAAFLGMGLYTYQAYKAFPLLVLIYGIYEWRAAPEKIKKSRQPLFLFSLLFLVLSAPLFIQWIEQGSLGVRESQAFIGKKIVEAGNLGPLFHHMLETALLFNRHGDDYPQHNLPGRRMLDDVTGVLFVFGFFYALSRIRQRQYFYPVLGLWVMSLPGLLAAEQTEAHRMLGITPFIALFSAGFIEKIWKKWPREWDFQGLRAGTTCVFFLLASAAFLNFRGYFFDQASNYDCWKSYSPEASLVSREMLGHSDTTFYLAPFFYYDYSVRYLCYSQKNSFQKFDPLLDFSKSNFTGIPEVCFALEEGKKGTLDLLEGIYPGGRAEIIRGPRQIPMVYFYYVPVGEIKAFKGLKRGLRGEYFPSSRCLGLPALIRWDPILNLTNISDFAILQPPLSIHWKGEILIPISGHYHFFLLTSKQGKVLIDERLLKGAQYDSNDGVELKRGRHSMDIYAEGDQEAGSATYCHLLWKEPSDVEYEIIPNRVFGGIGKGY